MCEDASSTEQGEERDACGIVHPLTKQIQREQKERVCLRCNRSFVSHGPGFRLCEWCRGYLRLNEDEDPHEEIARPDPRGRVVVSSTSAVQAMLRQVQGSELL